MISQIRGEMVIVDSSIPSPPGSRLEGEAEISSHEHFPFRVKVHGCTKRESRFEIRGRVLDLARHVRLVLEREVTPQTAEQTTPLEGAEDPSAAG